VEPLKALSGTSPFTVSSKTQSVVKNDDRRLIAECLGGRREAFSELVTRYQARLYNAALRLVDNSEDAADVVQDSFLNAFQSLHTFKGDAELFTWLYRIAFNTAVSLRRKRRAVLSLNGSGENGIDPYDPSEYVRPGSVLERSEDEAQLQSALTRLSSEHREVLLLKDIEGLKYEDIAEALAVPIGTIRSRLHRARLELRNLLLPLTEQLDGNLDGRLNDKLNEKLDEKPPLAGPPDETVPHSRTGMSPDLL
jgi:RNA polymerase sigma-70 factor, ECF subfamily